MHQFLTVVLCCGGKCEMCFSAWIWKLESCQSWYEKAGVLPQQIPEKCLPCVLAQQDIQPGALRSKPLYPPQDHTDHPTVGWLGYTRSTEQNEMLQNGLRALSGGIKRGRRKGWDESESTGTANRICRGEKIESDSVEAIKNNYKYLLGYLG